jgi:hypothetical protein
MVRQQYVDLSPIDKDPGLKVHKIVYAIDYHADGNFFYSRVKFTGTDGHRYDEERAYDGEHFQRLGRDSGVLMLSRTIRLDQPTQALMIQPIVYPFLFAFGESEQLDYPVLLNQSVWDRLARELTVREVEEPVGRFSWLSWI